MAQYHIWYCAFLFIFNGDMKEQYMLIPMDEVSKIFSDANGCELINLFMALNKAYNVYVNRIFEYMFINGI